MFEHALPEGLKRFPVLFETNVRNLRSHHQQNGNHSTLPSSLMLLRLNRELYGIKWQRNLMSAMGRSQSRQVWVESGH